MNTPPAHSFVRLRDAMLALAAWLDSLPEPTAPHAFEPDRASRPTGASGTFAATEPAGPAEPHGLRLLCAAGLRCLAANAKQYDLLIVRPNAFAAHFAATVAMLAPTAALANPSGTPADGQLDDAAFMLVEDMAALFRERSLRAPEDAPHEAEQALLDHFERCGEWLPADGTTVTDWYYVRLPALVLAQLLRRAEAASRVARHPGS
uniref:Uncharacterized protein n=1 Tax=Nitratidesulfovibrio vulgaris (strain DSM 19637 / Miyazaki F) TaxID=883 RepID=B8DK79_NITV9